MNKVGLAINLQVLEVTSRGQRELTVLDVIGVQDLLAGHHGRS